MPKDDAGPAVRLDGLPETTALSAPVLAVGLGRGSSGKSTVLAEMIWRAQAQGAISYRRGRRCPLEDALPSLC